MARAQSAELPPGAFKKLITGVHMIIYNREAEGVRALLGDIFESRKVDAGHGWLIFALPPAEIAVHPCEGDGRHEMYLMCDDIAITMRELSAKGVEFEAGPSDHGWGITTAMKMPGGDRLWLYQPKHPTALAG
jgi:hypothetical protein